MGSECSTKDLTWQQEETPKSASLMMRIFPAKFFLPFLGYPGFMLPSWRPRLVYRIRIRSTAKKITWPATGMYSWTIYLTHSTTLSKQTHKEGICA